MRMAWKNEPASFDATVSGDRSPSDEDHLCGVTLRPMKATILWKVEIASLRGDFRTSAAASLRRRPARRPGLVEGLARQQRRRGRQQERAQDRRDVGETDAVR